MLLLGCVGVADAVLAKLDAAEWRRLIDSIPAKTVRDLRDRALIATLTYSFARIAAALRMKVEDLRLPRGDQGRLIQINAPGDLSL